jgi:hypothetical protein
MLDFFYLEYLYVIIKGAQNKRLKSYHKTNVWLTTSVNEQIDPAVTHLSLTELSPS